MRRIAPLALLTTSALALSACGGESSADEAATGSKGTTKVTHAQGTTEVPAAPKRVAVLDFGVLDTADALGAKVVAAPKKGLPKSLSSYAGDDVADLGTLKEIDVEALAEANPDVILLGARSAGRYAELSEIAPTVDLTMADGDFGAALKKQVTTLGTVLGKSDEAAAKLAAVESEISDLKGKATNSGEALVVLVSGGKVSAFGPGTRAGGFIHDTLGVTPAIKDLKADPHGQAISFELIAKTDPDRLYVIDRDAAVGDEGKSAKEVLDNPLVKGTTAWKDDKVTYLDATSWYLVGGGVQTTPRMVDEVAQSLS